MHTSVLAYIPECNLSGSRALTTYSMTEYQKYSRFEVEKVRSGADIRLFIPNCDLRKTTQEVKCPFCGEKKLSVVHKKGKNFAHCFHCKEGFSSPIDAYMHYNGLAKDSFVEALGKVGAD